MIKRANIQWSAKTLAKYATGGKISFDNAIQRGYCWDNARKSLLIHSMLMGFPIPAFYAAKLLESDKAAYDMLDGKQRSGAIAEFLSDGYVLSDLPMVQYEKENKEEEYDVSGLKFSQLPEELRETICDYSLTVYYFEGITDDEISELFFRLNNGKPLSAIELTRAKAKDMTVIKQLASHPLFTDSLTDTALNKYVNEEIVFKSYVSLFKRNPSFETKYIRSVIENDTITPEHVEQLTKCYDFTLDILKQIENKKLKRVLLAKTHLLTLIRIVDYAFMEERQGNILGWLNSVWWTGTPTKDYEYNQAAQSGSAKMENVDTRHVMATNAFDEYCNGKGD